jgi:hypothetical protein
MDPTGGITSKPDELTSSPSGCRATIREARECLLIVCKGKIQEPVRKMRQDFYNGNVEGYLVRYPGGRICDTG